STPAAMVRSPGPDGPRGGVAVAAGVARARPLAARDPAAVVGVAAPAAEVRPPRGAGRAGGAGGGHHEAGRNPPLEGETDMTGLIVLVVALSPWVSERHVAQSQPAE